MLFTDSIFLFFFLPIALIIHRAAVGIGTKKKYPVSARITLFFLTLVFYGWKEPWWLIPFIISIVFDFLWASILMKTERVWVRRAALAASVVQNLALLSCFKYRDFLNQGFHFLPDMTQGGRSLLLPAGISFYTFESLSYVIDVYRGEIAPPLRASDFFSFIGMFPRFIAGPITRYPMIDRQLKDYRGMDVERGLMIFARGLFLKVIFADQFAQLVPYAFAHSRLPSSPVAAWIGVIAFSMQLYFDFSGYSLMSIGLGRCLGFEFPDNFDRPYLATSVTDFWKRWHRTLSMWVHDYLFVPMAMMFGGSALWLYFSLFVSFVLMGLWHGANWTFVAMGAWYGAFLCLEKLWPKKHRINVPLIRNFAVLAVVGGGWILFRAESISQATGIFAALFKRPEVAFDPGLLMTHFFSTGASVLGLLYCFCWEGRKISLLADISCPVWIEKFGTVLAVGFSFSVLFAAQKIPFLYFQF